MRQQPHHLLRQIQNLRVWRNQEMSCAGYSDYLKNLKYQYDIQQCQRSNGVAKCADCKLVDNCGMQNYS